MMASDHPSEIELFEEVEGELEPERSSAIRSHLETCPACAASIAELMRAREALRSSPLLELPAVRVSEMVATFPRRERTRRFFLARLTTLQRVGAAAAAVAAVVVAVTVVTTGNDNSAEPTAAGEAAATADRGAPALAQQAPEATTLPEDSAGAAPFEATPQAEPPKSESPTEATPQAEAQTTPPTEAPPPTKAVAPETTEPPPSAEATAATAPVASLEGTSADVVTLLEQLGFKATAVDDTTVQVAGASAAEVAQALEGRPPGPINVVVQEETP